MRVIALRTTMPEAELREAGADWVLKDCTGIASLGNEGGELSLRLS